MIGELAKYVTIDAIRLDFSALSARELAHIEDELRMRLFRRCMNLFGALVTNRLRQYRVAFDRFESQTFGRKLGVNFASFYVSQLTPSRPKRHTLALLPPFPLNIKRILIEPASANKIQRLTPKKLT